MLNWDAFKVRQCAPNGSQESDIKMEMLTRQVILSNLPFFGVFLLQTLGDSFKSFHSWEFFSLQFLQILCEFVLFSGDFFNFCVNGL